MLTYGDVGDRRGAYLGEMTQGDVVVFYAGLRSIDPNATQLIYAIVGLFVVDEVVAAADVPPERFDENAHTRKRKRGNSDIVVRAIPGQSGRLSRCLPIGEYRNKAYRVRSALLRKWGGLSVNDGYIQRSAVPPRFLRPEKFVRWLDTQDFELLEQNNDTPSISPLIIVHLRQPVRNNPQETRADPFWEFGSFGCTGCHGANLMNPRRADDLKGARFAFAQGGPDGFKLVKLTPPVTLVEHGDRVEVRWEPASMPFRYEEAPLLVNNQGKSDFPTLKKLLRNIHRTTWVARFSSRFRSNRTPLPSNVALELSSVYRRHERSAGTASVATSYEQALPYPPPLVDRNRKKTYADLLSSLRGGRTSRVCRPRVKRGRKC
jgi:hypothetical protein